MAINNTQNCKNIDLNLHLVDASRKHKDEDPESLGHLNFFDTNNLGLFKEVIQRGISLISKRLRECKRPFSGILPHELAERFTGVDLDYPQDTLDHALVELEDLYLRDAVYFHLPQYMAHLNPPVAHPAVLAELIQASFNTAVDTWDQSGGATFIEQKLVDWTIGRIGFNAEHADGVFTSGGTQSNLMALLLARDQYCLNFMNGHSVQHHGLPKNAENFRIFTSSASHFSVQKGAALLGLGYDAVISVAVDSNFRMDVMELEKQIHMCKSNGGIPIAVVATIGTTDYGSIDPVAHISDICRRENLWLHADAAYGCGLLVSQRYRESIRDIHLADSVTVDFHKSFFQPVACGAFFCKNKHALACITYHAEYLNPLSQAEEGTPNLVCKSLQTTRRFDALKLWLTLRTNGPQAIGNAFDKVIDLAKKIYDQHRDDRALEFIHRPELSTLVFRYVSQFTDRECPEIDVNAINQKIRKRLMRSGDLLIASTTWRDQCYLKLTLLNPEATLDEISHALKTIQATGDLISRQSSTLHPLDIVP